MYVEYMKSIVYIIFFLQKDYLELTFDNFRLYIIGLLLFLKFFLWPFSIKDRIVPGSMAAGPTISKFVRLSVTRLERVYTRLIEKLWLPNFIIYVHVRIKREAWRIVQ